MPTTLDIEFEKKLESIFIARSKLSQLQVIPNCIRQTPALAKELFQLQRTDSTNYYFSPVAKTNSNLPIPDGLFHFVIFSVDPLSVYCGLRKSQPNVPRIGGHTSISGGTTVLMAGDFTLQQGRLLSWNSGSGHYRPQKRHVENNLLPPVRLLLPVNLYKNYWE